MEAKVKQILHSEQVNLSFYLVIFAVSETPYSYDMIGHYIDNKKRRYLWNKSQILPFSANLIT